MRKRGASPGNGNNCTHNLKVIGSNPIPATKIKGPREHCCFRGLFHSPPALFLPHRDRRFQNRIAVMIGEIACGEANGLDRKTGAPEREVFDDLLFPELERMVEAVLAAVAGHIDDQHELIRNPPGVRRRPADQKRSVVTKFCALCFGVGDRRIGGIEVVMIDREVAIVLFGIGLYPLMRQR